MPLCLSLPSADCPRHHAFWAFARGETVHSGLIHIEPVATVAGAVDRILVLVTSRRASRLRGAFLHEDPQDRSCQSRLSFRSGRAGWPDSTCKACGTDLPGRTWRSDGADLSGNSLRSLGTGRPRESRSSNRSRRPHRARRSRLPPWSKLAARARHPLRSLGSLVSGKALGSLWTGWAGRSFRTHGTRRSGLPFEGRLSFHCSRWPRRSLWACRTGWSWRSIAPGFTLRAWRAGDALRPWMAFRSGRALWTRNSIAPRLASRSGCSRLALGAGLGRRKCSGGHTARSFRTFLAAETDNGLPLLRLGLKGHDAGRRMVGETEDEAPVGVRSRLMPFIEGDRHLAGFAQPPDDAQLPARYHGLIDYDVGHGRNTAGDEDGSG